MFFFLRNKRLTNHVKNDVKRAVQALNPFSTADVADHIKKAQGKIEGSATGSEVYYHAYKNLPVERDGFVVVAWAKLCNRNDLGTKLDIKKNHLQRTDDAELILLSWIKWKELCIQHLVGEFSFVIYDLLEEKAFCCRDHIGSRPLYFVDSSDYFACSSNIPSLITLDQTSSKVSKRWLTEYFVNLSESFTDTPYENIKKIPPGTSLHWSRNGYSYQKYYELQCPPSSGSANFEEYLELYRNQLTDAVVSRIDDKGMVGIETSGGLDSSTIAAIASDYLQGDPDRIHLLSFLYFEKEPDYICSLLEQCGFPETHFFNYELLARQHRIGKRRALKMFGHPVEHLSSTFHMPFYSLAQKLDIKYLMSGFGGDEFVTNVHYNLVWSEWLEKKKYVTFYSNLPGGFIKKGKEFIRAYRSHRRPESSLAKKYNLSLMSTLSAEYTECVLTPELKKQYHIKNRLKEKATFDSGYTNLNKFLVEKRWQPFIPTRLEQCSLMAASYGLEYRWPLLDVRLLEQYLSMPPELSYRDGIGRYLHRRAIENKVPDRIVWNNDKDMGSNMVSQRATADIDMQSLEKQLHPILREMLDYPKLEKTHNLRSGEVLVELKRIVHMRNVEKIISVNDWLHEAHPN